MILTERASSPDILLLVSIAISLAFFCIRPLLFFSEVSALFCSAAIASLMLASSCLDLPISALRSSESCLPLSPG
nr:MAG TPA: hypothetical protein [Caudoviricetes sp.]